MTEIVVTVNQMPEVVKVRQPGHPPVEFMPAEGMGQLRQERDDLRLALAAERAASAAMRAALARYASEVNWNGPLCRRWQQREHGWLKAQTALAAAAKALEMAP